MFRSPSKRRSTLRRPQSSPNSYTQCEPRLLLATFTGTEGDDVVSINVGSNSLELVINDTTTTVTSTELHEIDGLGASFFDSIEITRDAGIDVVFENGVLEVGNFSIAIRNFDTLSIPDGFTVQGTAGDDTIEFILVSELLFEPTLRVNGAVQLPTLSYETSFHIEGAGGHDRFVSGVGSLSGLFPRQISPDGGDRISWSNLEEADLESGDFQNIELTGTDGDDVLTTDLFSNARDIVFTPSQGPEITIALTGGGAPSFTVIAGEGNDSASLSASTNRFIQFSGGPDLSTYSASNGGPIRGVSIAVNGFEVVSADGGPRGFATITGSAADESAILNSFNDSLEVAGDSWSIEVANFSEASVLGGGGNDALQLDSNFFNFDGSGRAEFETSNNTRFEISDFSAFDFVSFSAPQVVNSIPDSSLELDLSGSKAVLRHSLSPIVVSSQNGFSRVSASLDLSDPAQNRSISVVVPPDDSVVLSIEQDQISNAGTSLAGTSDLLENLILDFDSIHLQGHGDSGDLSFQRTLQFSAIIKDLTFDGSTLMFPLYLFTSPTESFRNISSSNFSSTVVEIDDPLDEPRIAVLAGDDTGANTFTAMVTDETVAGTITTPNNQTLSVFGFDRLEAVSAHEDDVVSVDLVSTGNDRLIFDGQQVFIDIASEVELDVAGFRTVNVDSVGGDDRAFLRGSDQGDNVFEGNQNRGVLTTPDAVIAASGFGLVAASAVGANDQAFLQGSSNAENFFASPVNARLVGNDFALNAAGFPQVVAYGGAGDYANLTDSQGNDLFTADPDLASLVFEDGSSVRATRFETVRSVSSSGDDNALLRGSDGDDRFLSTAGRFGRLDGDGYSLIAVSYPAVAANGLQGSDRAVLNDSAGDDSFIASKTNSVLSGDGFENSARNFDSVFATATDGNDLAEFRGSQDDEAFYANPFVAHLTGDVNFIFGGGFDATTAISGGGADSARLRDSSGNDTFTSNHNMARLAGVGFTNQVFGFANVRAVSLSGIDEAVFAGSVGVDTFVGTSDFTYLEGVGFRNQANGFRNTTARGLAGSDSAFLYDSEQDETFSASNNAATLDSETYRIQLFDFSTVDVYGFNGGFNTLVINETNFAVNNFGTWL